MQVLTTAVKAMPCGNIKMEDSCWFACLLSSEEMIQGKLLGKECRAYLGRTFSRKSECTSALSGVWGAHDWKWYTWQDLNLRPTVKVTEQFYIKRRQIEACRQALRIIEGGERKAS